MDSLFNNLFKHNHNIANDDPCKDNRNELYNHLDKSLNERGSRGEFFISQAIWTPDGKAIAKHTLNIADPKPNLYRWTESQYTSGGPFDKWLRTVQTCYTRLACCSVSGFANIIMRDFPTPESSSAIVSKNFKGPVGAQGDCEKNELFKEEQKRKEEAARLAEEKRQAVEKWRSAMKATQVRTSKTFL